MFESVNTLSLTYSSRRRNLRVLNYFLHLILFYQPNLIKYIWWLRDCKPERLSRSWWWKKKIVKTPDNVDRIIYAKFIAIQTFEYFQQRSEEAEVDSQAEKVGRLLAWHTKRRVFVLSYRVSFENNVFCTASRRNYWISWEHWWRRIKFSSKRDFLDIFKRNFNEVKQRKI